MSEVENSGFDVESSIYIYSHLFVWVPNKYANSLCSSFGTVTDTLA